eukprot:1540226-Rhodomonas_salina.2
MGRQERPHYVGRELQGPAWLGTSAMLPAKEAGRAARGEAAKRADAVIRPGRYVTAAGMGRDWTRTRDLFGTVPVGTGTGLRTVTLARMRPSHVVGFGGRRASCTAWCRQIGGSV